MSWCFYLENFILLTGLSGLGAGAYFRHKQNYFQQLFKDLQKCQKYHLDYVDQISHLPLNKKAILFGTARSKDPSLPTILKSVIKKKQSQDRLWNCQLKESFGLEANEGQVEVSVPQQTVLAFNWLKGQGESSTHEERIIYHNEPVCVYGQVESNQRGGRRVIPEVIMGSQHDKLLQYLDAEMVRLSNRGKVFIVTGTILFGAHFCYKMWKKYEQRQQKMLALLEEQQSSESK